MSRARMSFASGRAMAGLSLIEMMIALVMALIVAAGIITVFQSTSSSNRVQSQLATLQEEGRFAIHSLRGDLANANGSYCSNSGGNAGATGSGLYLDALRSPIIYSESALSFPDNTITLPAPSGAYSLPSSIYIRGYDCPASGTCTPAGLASLAPGIPPMGTAPATSTKLPDRVPGASVLTIRYLKPGSGWAIVPTGTAPGSTVDTTGGTTTITLGQLPDELPPNDFTGSLAMLADCSNAQVYAVSGGGSGTLTVLGSGSNYAQPADMSQTHSAAPRVFDFSKDFQTVTYYLQVVDAGNGHTTGELMRRVNGEAAQSLVRGVERLDFRYGIINGNGVTEFLTADQVDTATDSNGSISCPPGVSTPGGMPATGCLWRAVKTIQVNLLMDGQTPLYTLTPQEMNYIYTPDGNTSPQPPGSVRNVTPVQQGFPNHLLRREFTTVVALRNFNP